MSKLHIFFINSMYLYSQVSPNVHKCVSITHEGVLLHPYEHLNQANECASLGQGTRSCVSYHIGICLFSNLHYYGFIITWEETHPKTHRHVSRAIQAYITNFYRSSMCLNLWFSTIQTKIEIFNYSSFKPISLLYKPLNKLLHKFPPTPLNNKFYTSLTNVYTNISSSIIPVIIS